MKKIISILLAMLMIFSIATVAFAADGDPVDDPAVVNTDGDETADEGEEDSFEVTDLPFWTVKVGFKLGKVVLKLAKAFLKVASALGLIDVQEILQGLIDQITASQEGETTDGEATTSPLDGILDFSWLNNAA